MCHKIKNFCAGIGKKKSDDIGKYTPPPGEVYDGFIVFLRNIKAFLDVIIEEEKYVVTDTFLSYGLHMTRSKSDARFVCHMCCVCCLKLVVNRN